LKNKDLTEKVEIKAHKLLRRHINDYEVYVAGEVSGKLGTAHGRSPLIERG